MAGGTAECRCTRSRPAARMTETSRSCSSGGIWLHSSYAIRAASDFLTGIVLGTLSHGDAEESSLTQRSDVRLFRSARDSVFANSSGLANTVMYTLLFEPLQNTTAPRFSPSAPVSGPRNWPTTPMCASWLPGPSSVRHLWGRSLRCSPLVSIPELGETWPRT